MRRTGIVVITASLLLASCGDGGAFFQDTAPGTTSASSTEATTPTGPGAPPATEVSPPPTESPHPTTDAGVIVPPPIDPEAITACEGIADAGIEMLQVTVDFFDSPDAADAGGDDWSEEEAAAAFAEMTAMTRRLLDRAAVLGCDPGQVDALVHTRLADVAVTGEAGEVAIELIETGVLDVWEVVSWDEDGALDGDDGNAASWPSDISAIDGCEGLADAIIAEIQWTIDRVDRAWDDDPDSLEDVVGALEPQLLAWGEELRSRAGELGCSDSEINGLVDERLYVLYAMTWFGQEIIDRLEEEGFDLNA